MGGVQSERRFLLSSPQGLRGARLGLCDAVAGVLLGACLKFPGLLLCLGDYAIGVALHPSEQLGSGIVRRAQDSRSLLSERRRERRLVEDGVLDPFLGFRQEFTKSLFAFLRGRHLASYLLEVSPHLRRIETAPRRPEGVSGHLARP